MRRYFRRGKHRVRSSFSLRVKDIHRKLIAEQAPPSWGPIFGEWLKVMYP